MIDDPQLRTSERLRLLAGVAGALDDLHTPQSSRPGFTHGDVKPSNVVLTAPGRPVLVDVGGLVPVDGPAPGQPLTSAPYTAPELRTTGYVPTPASDRFAFFVTAAQVLTGCPPEATADGFTDVPALLAQVRGARLADNPRMAGQLAAALTAAPSQRPAPLAAWLRTLSTVASDSTVPPAGAGPPRRRLRRPGRRAGAALIVAAAVVGITSGALFAGVWNGAGPPSIDDVTTTLNAAPTAGFTATPVTPPAPTSRPTATGTTSTPAVAESDGTAAGTGPTTSRDGVRKASLPPTAVLPKQNPSTSKPVTIPPISNPAAWQRGPGPFDVSRDCGAWYSGLDRDGGSGVQIRSCASRVGQVASAGLEVRSVDGARHRILPSATSWTCVDGPAQCNKLGSVSADSGPVLRPVAAVVGGDSSWSLSATRSINWGSHRCIGTVAVLGGSAKAISAFRLDWEQVRTDSGIGTTPRWTCPTPTAPAFSRSGMR